jgi:hypothetical protein
MDPFSAKSRASLGSEFPYQGQRTPRLWRKRYALWTHTPDAEIVLFRINTETGFGGPAEQYLLPMRRTHLLRCYRVKANA